MTKILDDIERMIYERQRQYEKTDGGYSVERDRLYIELELLRKIRIMIV